MAFISFEGEWFLQSLTCLIMLNVVKRSRIDEAY